jgi:HK97 family phage portal protein
MGLLQQLVTMLYNRYDDGTKKQTETRIASAENSQIFALSKYEFNLLGNTDPQVATADQLRKYTRGLWARLLQFRADAIARSILGSAMVEGWEVERMGRDGKYVRIEEGGNPWARLIADPCPNMSAREFWSWVSQSRDYTGTADLLVEHNALGMPIALYPVFREFGIMNPKSDGTGGVMSWVFNRADGIIVQLEKRDIIRLNLTSSWSPYENVSLLEWGILEVDTDLHQSLYRKDAAKTGHTPPLVLTTEQRVTNEEADAAGKRFLQKYQTAGNIKGIPILGQGVQPHRTGMNADDLAAIDSQKLTDTHLFWIAGFPQGLLSDDSNRSNALQAERTFAVITVQPQSDALASQMTHNLQEQFGSSGLRISAGNVIPVDRKQEAEIDRILLGAGLTMNEIREKRRLDPVEGGDVVLVRRDMMPLKEMLIQAEADPTNTDAPDTPDTPETPDTVVKALMSTERFKRLTAAF